MRKFKIFADNRKEEKWLCDMARKGYELENVCFGYRFKRSEPKDTVIRIDCREFKAKEDFVDYCALFEDSGWKHIAGSRNSGVQYFKKIDEHGDNDIFSDEFSKAEKYKRISQMWLRLAVLYLPLLIVFIIEGVIDINAMLNPKLLYYTPGLWEKTGSLFWRAFLFETPFALFRGFLWLFIPVTIISYLFFSIKAKMLYKEYKK